MPCVAPDNPCTHGGAGQAPRAEPRGQRWPCRAAVAGALPRLSLRSPAELRAARGRTVSATLPPSTRVLLKRREVAEVERELQNQRQVSVPSPGSVGVPWGQGG